MNFINTLLKIISFQKKNLFLSKPDIKGKIYTTFIIEKDGSLNDVKILRDCGFGTGQETIRVLKLSPKWIPGKLKNKEVRVLYSLPVIVN